MNEIRTKELFESFFHYWIVELKLHNKYRFVLKKDNRLNCHAWVDLKSQNHYEIKYNASRLKSRYKIINVVLHEVGHLFLDWRSTDEVMHEAEAEYFALSTMKQNYPKFYKRALNWTKKVVMDKIVDEVHLQGYIKALQKLGELPKDF
jgi:hypothetical protein